MAKLGLSELQNSNTPNRMSQNMALVNMSAIWPCRACTPKFKLIAPVWAS